MFSFVLFIPAFFIVSVGNIFAAETTVDWVNYLLNGGPFAIVVFLMITDKIATTSERDRLRIENNALRDEVKVLNESIRNEIVPPLVQINALMKDVVEELSDRGRYYPPEQRGR